MKHIRCVDIEELLLIFAYMILLWTFQWKYNFVRNEKENKLNTRAHTRTDTCTNNSKMNQIDTHRKRKQISKLSDMHERVA